MTIVNRNYGQEPYLLKGFTSLICWFAVGSSFALTSLWGVTSWGHEISIPDQDDVGQTHQVELAAKIDSLIKQLGDPDFYDRENAEKELLSIGRPAIEPVRDSRFAKDNEIRLRVRRLLTKLLRNDFQRQLHDFLQDDSNTVSLPAWKAFSQIAGTQQTAKELFASMYANSPELFLALENHDLQPARIHYKKLLTEFGRVQMSLALVCSILFADTYGFEPPSYDNSRPHDESQRIWTQSRELVRTSSHLKNSNVVSFASSGGFQTEFKAVLTHWLLHLPTDNQTLRASRLVIVEKFKLVELLPMIVEIFNDDHETIYSKAKAIVIVARVGNESNVKSLQLLLSNKQVVGHFENEYADRESRGVKLEVQLRDIALAASVFLSKQSLEEYGFANSPDQDDRFISISQAGFATQQKRKAAFGKWTQFHQEHLSPTE